MIKSLNFLLCVLFGLFSNAQQHIAVCQEGMGCQIMKIKSTSEQIDSVLGKTEFFSKASDSATLVIVGCTQKIEEKKTVAQIHKQYGGKGAPKKLSSFDIKKYLKDKGCLKCPNNTQKISFYISGDEQSGSGYFFLNLKAGEAYMPNAAFQQFMSSQEGAGDMIVDQFLRNNFMETYSVVEGKKYHTKMPIGTTISMIQADAINEKRFKDEFKKSGKTRKHLNTVKEETEYIGKDDEGKTIHFWIVPVENICLPAGKFDAFGFFNLGYISVNNNTYLVTEISGSGFQIKLTGITDGSYSFNPAGYQSY